jgi:hypothetical protein
MSTLRHPDVVDKPVSKKFGEDTGGDTPRKFHNIN